jgi:hypothetical protein
LLAVWVSNPTWRTVANVSRQHFMGLRETSTPEGGVRAVPRLCINLCPSICLTTEDNHDKTSVRASKKCSAYQRRARFVWSTWPSTSGGLDLPVGTRRSRFTLRETGSTFGQNTFLQSCRTKRFPASANFESKLAVRL